MIIFFIYLVILVTGFVVSCFYFKKAALLLIGKNTQMGTPTSMCQTILVTLLVVESIKASIISINIVPSVSMLPTLLVGDIVVVNRLAYGLKLPLTHCTVIAEEAPFRGDVVALRYPGAEKKIYVKRVVGLPGDRIEYKNNQLLVNGLLQSKKTNEKAHWTSTEVKILSGKTMETRVTKHLIESAVYYEQDPQVNYQVLVSDSDARQEPPLVIPEGYYYVLGDNRNYSDDSRYFGLVPQDNLIGKAEYILTSRGKEGFRSDRQFTKVHTLTPSLDKEITYTDKNDTRKGNKKVDI